MVQSILLAGNLFPHVFSGIGGLLYALILALVALGLMFAGRSIIKGLAFLVVGLAGAAVGASLGAIVLGVLGSIVGGVLGFLIGGVIGIWLVEVGVALALGYYAYTATRYLVHSFPVAVVVGVILFLIGLAIANKVLELVTAVLGGLIFYNVLIYFGAGSLASGAISFVLAVAGFYVQYSRRRLTDQWRRT